MKHLSNAALRLDQRQRRCVDIETALCHRFVSDSNILGHSSNNCVNNRSQKFQKIAKSLETVTVFR